MPSEDLHLVLGMYVFLVGGVMLFYPRAEDQAAYKQITAIAEDVRGQPLSLSCSKDGELDYGTERNCQERNGFRFVKYGLTGVAVVKLIDREPPRMVLRSELGGENYRAPLSELIEARKAFSMEAHVSGKGGIP
jgi:hypothetical protein